MGGGQATEQALALNTTLMRLNLGNTQLRERGGRATGNALAVNITLRELRMHANLVGVAVGYLTPLNIGKRPGLAWSD